MANLKSALLSLPLVGAMSFISSHAIAQEGDGEEAPAGAAAAEASSEGSDDDGVRFRGGVSGGGGALIGAGLTLGMGGFDGRMGVQINDLIGVYAQPQLSIYGGSAGFLSGVGGIAGGTAVVDFTFIDQIFVGAGAGYAVLNNPHGPVVHIRAGGYPLFGYGEDGIRRKGLMLGADLRLHIVSGEVFVAPMASIGYEAF